MDPKCHFHVHKKGCGGMYIKVHMPIFLSPGVLDVTCFSQAGSLKHLDVCHPQWCHPIMPNDLFYACWL